MIFQTLDSKKECYAIFCEDNFYHYPNGLELTHTWAYSPHVEGDIEYAQIWCAGKNFSDVCPEYLKDRWNKVNKRLQAFSRAFKNAKINPDDVCIYSLIPNKFLLEASSMKNEITNWVFEHYKKPDNYRLMSDLAALLHKIRNQKINLRTENLDFINPKVRKNFNKIKNANNKIDYNPWSTVTGRLTTNQNSFPILTLNRELRSVLTPTNDLFVELDYNSAELRTFLGLLGEKQPEKDLHSWISEEIFLNKYSRDQTKKKVFAWLYNPQAKNKKLNEKFDRAQLLKKYYANGVVSTPYGRCIEVDGQKALNYMIQSTASDLFLTSMLKIDKMLKNRKSFVAFSIHDSLILDISREDQPLIDEIVKEFSKTKFGVFKTNLSIGRNFGEMRDIE